MELEKFDIEKAKAGRKVVTRLGLPVEILKWDANIRGDEIVGLIEQLDKTHKLSTFGLDGTYYDSKSPDERDLFMAPEERYVVLMKNKHGEIYTSEEVFNLPPDNSQIDYIKAPGHTIEGTYKLVKV